MIHDRPHPRGRLPGDPGVAAGQPGRAADGGVAQHAAGGPGAARAVLGRLPGGGPGAPLPPPVERGPAAGGLRHLHAAQPLPAITGRVCPHFCETACNRDPYDGPLAIRSLERYLGDAAADLALGGPEEATGKSVAVVGSGPAGLSAAYYLRRSGHEVVVYEKRDRPGGLLRYGIPEYRLPEAVVDAEVARLEALGIEFRTGVALGEGLGLEDLKEAHDAVVVATGAWEGQPMGMPGESLLEAGLEYLEQVARGRVALPGPALRRDRRRQHRHGRGPGAAPPGRRGHRALPAHRRRDAGHRRGVRRGRARRGGLRVPQPAAGGGQGGGGAAPHGGAHAPGPPDASGRARPEPTGATVDLRFDAVFKAIGEKADLAPFPDALRTGPGGWLAVGAGGSTGDPAVFVGGDLATGPATVVAAIGRGREAADAVNARLGGGYRLPAWVRDEAAEVVASGEVNPAYFAPAGGGPSRPRSRRPPGPAGCWERRPPPSRPPRRWPRSSAATPAATATTAAPASCSAPTPPSAGTTRGRCSTTSTARGAASAPWSAPGTCWCS